MTDAIKLPPRPACQPWSHTWACETCTKCAWTKEDLLEFAKHTVEALQPTLLKDAVLQGTGCRSCDSKGRDVQGWPCGCGAPPQPAFTRHEVDVIGSSEYKAGVKAAQEYVRGRALLLFSRSEDASAKHLRDVADLLKKGNFA